MGLFLAMLFWIGLNWMPGTHLSSHPPLRRALLTRFNDPEFEPITHAIPDSHHDFRHPIALPFSAMPGPVTPDFIANKLNDINAKVLHMSTISQAGTFCKSVFHLLTFFWNYHR
jgi:hypothetical protein